MAEMTEEHSLVSREGRVQCGPKQARWPLVEEVAFNWGEVSGVIWSNGEAAAGAMKFALVKYVSSSASMVILKGELATRTIPCTGVDLKEQAKRNK